MKRNILWALLLLSQSVANAAVVREEVENIVTVSQDVVTICPAEGSFEFGNTMAVWLRLKASPGHEGYVGDVEVIGGTDQGDLENHPVASIFIEDGFAFVDLSVLSLLEASDCVTLRWSEENAGNGFTSLLEDAAQLTVHRFDLE